MPAVRNWSIRPILGSALLAACMLGLVELRAGLAHDPQSGRADDHTLTIYGDPPECLKREILPRADDNGHFPSWQARDRDGGADAAAHVLNQMRGGILRDPARIPGCPFSRAWGCRPRPARHADCQAHP